MSPSSIRASRSKGDRRSYHRGRTRILSPVQPLFSQGLVYAPDRAWADMWLTELSLFPNGKYDDLVDTTTQALKHLRGVGAIQFDDDPTCQTRPRLPG